LDCSGVLGINFAEANRELTALLQQFLTTPSPIFDGTDFALIQACAVERLAQNLHQPSAGEDVAMSAVYALLNILYSHNTSSKEKLPVVQEQSTKIQENIVAAISKIACVLQSEKVRVRRWIQVCFWRLLFDISQTYFLIDSIIDHSSGPVDAGSANSP
jgi:hypothetical protein